MEPGESFVPYLHQDGVLLEPSEASLVLGRSEENAGTSIGDCIAACVGTNPPTVHPKP